MINVEQTIISQYANSPTIVKLIQNMNEYIDPRADLDNFYNFVWNVDTAQGFGLDIWGRIVNISRELSVPTPEDYFGFDTSIYNYDLFVPSGSDSLIDFNGEVFFVEGAGDVGEQSFTPFNEAPFYSGLPPATSTYTLTDDAYRTLILVKALANISATNAPSLNTLLNNLFSARGRAYVNDYQNMQMRYMFEFILTPYEFAIVTQSGAFIRPAGVRAYVVNTELPVFGFSPDAAPFNQAPFINEGATYAII